jgi:hypothetical protein
MGRAHSSSFRPNPEDRDTGTLKTAWMGAEFDRVVFQSLIAMQSFYIKSNSWGGAGGNIIGGKLVQATLYLCMELSQRNPLVLMYANSELKFQKEK